MDDEPYFMISDWKKDIDIRFFCLETYDGDFEEQLKSFLGFLNRLFEENKGLRDILLGNRWGYFPFDWRGMK
jgi:hypothetical protein